jgi:hypothetical protein
MTKVLHTSTPRVVESETARMRWRPSKVYDIEEKEGDAFDLASKLESDYSKLDVKSPKVIKQIIFG